MSGESNIIRIMAVDDHPLLRQGIAGFVATQPDMKMVAEASNWREAIQQFRAHRPDVTLMDLQMPEMNGVDAISAIRGEFHQARIILLTTYTGDIQVLRALKAGAQGYLLKNSLDKQLLDVIRAVHSGQRRISPEGAFQIAEHGTDDSLTPAEIRVLSLIASGNANKEIATQLSVSEETIKRQVRNILSKLVGWPTSIRNTIVRADTFADHDGLSAFLSARARLFGIAYRILKSAAEAEDIVQDVWIRWQTTDRSAVRDAAAFLATTTTRLAINVIHSARWRRETTVRPSLRELVDTSADPELEAKRREALHSAALVLLQKLSPAERTTYVLREAFDYSYREMTNILHVQEANARQLVARARRRVANGRHDEVTPASAKQARPICQKCARIRCFSSD